MIIFELSSVSMCVCLLVRNDRLDMFSNHKSNGGENDSKIAQKISLTFSLSINLISLCNDFIKCHGDLILTWWTSEKDIAAEGLIDSAMSLT